MKVSIAEDYHRPRCWCAAALSHYRPVLIPVIFLSGEADSNYVAAGLELGAIAFITKPFYPEVFTSIVEEALARFAA
jgi:DNA-binding response OmpR family regulator